MLKRRKKKIKGGTTKLILEANNSHGQFPGVIILLTSPVTNDRELYMRVKLEKSNKVIHEGALKTADELL